MVWTISSMHVLLVMLAAFAAGASAGPVEDRLANALLRQLGAEPHRVYRYDEALLVSAHRTADNAYDIEINVKAVDPRDPLKYKLLKCHGEVTECADTGKLSVTEDTSGCVEEAPLTTESTKDREGPMEERAEGNLQDTVQETVQDAQTSWEGQSEEDLEVTTEVEYRAVKLDHEVLPGNQVTSGEQFVAVRREHTGPGPCIGCSSLVDVTAPGVDVLAALAVKHIDRHQPAERHRLNKVLVVERQVQVVNGVRYILTLNVDYDNCSVDNLDSCLQTKTCRVSILEKPWLKLPDGSKFRAIVSNNCTNEYLFGDNGEVLPNIPESSHENKDNEIDVNFNPDSTNRDGINHNANEPTPDYDAIANSGSVDDILKVVHNTELQANIPQKERELTPEEVKNLEDQIIPTSELLASQSTTEREQGQDHKIVAYVDNAEPNVVQTHIHTANAASLGHTSLSEDQQKALDGLMGYFDTQETIRQRRKRRNINDADENVRKLAQHFVDTLNTFDTHVNNRKLVEILSADEENTNGKHLYYIRAKVAFPPQDGAKNNEDTIKICNAVVDVSNTNVPRVLKSFCNPTRRSRILGGRRRIDVDSPDLVRLIEQALKKIQVESSYETKLKVLNVLSADRQVVSGTITTLSLELGFTNCSKSVSVDIAHCDIQNELGSTICKVHSLNQPWLKSNTITFKCFDSPPLPNISDPQVIQLAQESLQQFELTSENKNKLKIIQIHSVTMQHVAGTLTKFIYDVGITKCSKENKDTILDQCELLENSPTHRCKASIYNRPWIQDGKEITVKCESNSKNVKKDNCGIPGGVCPQNVNDPEFVQLAQKSLQELEKLSDSKYRQKVVKIIRVTTEVVFGISTSIDFSVGYTKCLKNGVNNLDTCELLEEKPFRQCHSKIWTISSNETQITVTCDDDPKVRTKRECGLPGGVCPVNENDPANIELAKQSLEILEQLSTSEFRQKIIKINHVTSQVVAGSMTRIDFDVGYTKCGKNDLSANLDSCELLEDRPLRKCNSEIWTRLWLHGPDRQKITVTCDDDAKKRTKRDLCGMPGGACQQNIHDPEFVQLAQKSLQELEKSSASEYQQKLVEIKHVMTQVVSGISTSIDFSVGYTKCLKNGVNNLDTCELLEGKPIRQCHSNIWTRSSDETQITVTCDDDPKVRTKRECGLPGGACAVNENDPANLELAKKSLEILEQLSTSEYRQKIIKINHVTSQVVAGSMTRIDFDVGYTKCGKNDLSANIDSCELLEDRPLRQCHSEIWTRLWLKGPDRELINVTCKNNDPIRIKRATIENDCATFGVVCTVDENEPENIKLAQESLQQLEKLSTSDYRQKIVKITSATKQVVEGTLTKINFNIGYTKCLQKELTVNLESCQLLSDMPIRQCHSEIWNRPWINDGKEITVTCEDQATITGKWNRTCQLSGEPCEIDKNSPENIKLAEESLKKLEQLSDSQYKQRIVKIKSVKKQLVSGTLHKIDFDVGYTRCTVNDILQEEDICELLQDVPIRHCHSEIWNRPWIPDGKEINVTCDNTGERDSACGLPGGVCTVDKHNPENLKLAQESLIDLENKLHSENRLKIVTIRSVTRQVLKTVITKINFDIGDTECLVRDKVDNVDKDCPLIKDMPLRQCQSEITVTPWLENSKKIDVNCNDNLTNYYFEYTVNSPTNFLRNRRNLPIISSDTYGLEDMTLARDAVDILNSRSLTANALKVLKIRSLKRDLNNALIRVNFDAATTMCLTKEHVDPDECDVLENLPTKHCHAKGWRRRNSKHRDLSVYCDDEMPMSLRILSDSVWLNDESADKTENLKQAQLALEKLTDTSYKMKALKVLSISRKQTDESGKTIVFLSGYTNCSFDHPIAQLSQCKIIKSKLIRLCQAVIWQPGNMESTIQCDSRFRSKRSRPPQMLDPNTEIVRLLAKDSLVQLELMSSATSRQKVIKVNSADFLPGDLSRVNFDIAYTKCSKYELVENVDDCESLLNAPHRRCVSEIWKRNWLKQGFVLDVNCNDKSEGKLSDYETALQLAELTLKHIEAKYIHPNKQTVVKIIAMDKQIIAGLHYRIKLEVGFTDCLVFDTRTDCTVSDQFGANKFCKANIWMRPWLNQPPNIRVSCELGNDTLNSEEIHLHRTTETLFSKFLATHKRDYIDDRVEFNKRFNIFKNNIKRIHKLNVHERGTATYGVTKFADMTYEEFKKKHTGLRPDLRSNSSLPQAHIPHNDDLPSSFDWRDKGAVTAVKDQGSCGSCWAFSVTGNIEGQWFLKKGALVSLSEQELVDCDKLDEGCNGGLPDNAYRAIEQLGGLEGEKDYPYDAEDEKCKYSADKVAARISSAVNISADEGDMAKWLVQNGPISIGINANGMQFYMGGVSHPWKFVCNPKNLDHGVLIVGYGVKEYPLFHKTLPYWIVKNSWGPSWGEQGYYRVFRGDGTCGLNQMASSAVV